MKPLLTSLETSLRYGVLRLADNSFGWTLLQGDEPQMDLVCRPFATEEDAKRNADAYFKRTIEKCLSRT